MLLLLGTLYKVNGIFRTRALGIQHIANLNWLIALRLVVFGGAAATMLLEVSLTRVYSYVLEYHFVPLVVASALLGIGGGGAVAWWLGKRLDRQAQLGATVGGLLVVSGLSVLVLPIVLLWLPQGSNPTAQLAVASSLPFFFSGGALALAFTAKPQDAGWLYAGDLLGAAGGVFSSVILMNRVGPIGTSYFSMAVFLLSGWLITTVSLPRMRRFLFVGLPFLILAIWMLMPVVQGFVAIQPQALSKTLGTILHNPDTEARLIFSQWDAFSRTDVVESQRQPNVKAIYVDGLAGSPMYRFDGDLSKLAYLRKEIQYLPFQIRAADSVLAIGPGGGEDIILALLAGSEQITAVEVNPGTLAALRHFADFNGNTYSRPEVEVVMDEGRSFLRRTPTNFDLIYLGLVTSYVSELGNFALAESYIYTVEAFRDYLDHLRPGGHVALMLHDERDSLRAFVSALVAVAGDGANAEQLANAAHHLALFVQPGGQSIGGSSPTDQRALLLIGREPLDTTSDRLLGTALERGVTPLFVPGAVEGGMVAQLGQGKAGLDTLISALDYNVGPTYDRQPFFFLFERGLPQSLQKLGQLAIITIVLALGLAIISAYRARSGRAWFFYFGLIGTAFAAAEIALSQSLVLLLGHPTRAFTVVLVALLGWGALGSVISARFIDLQRLRGFATNTTFALAIVCIGYGAGLIPLTQHLIITALPMRVLVAVLIIAPLGILLGIPFPTGLRLVSEVISDKGNIGVLWILNGLMAVVGAVGALVVAITFGFPEVLIGAGILYAIVAWLLR